MSSFAIKLDKLFVNNKWQNSSFISNKYVSQVLNQTLHATKMNFEKLLGQHVFKNHSCNPFQSSSSLSIRASFGICSVIYTFFQHHEHLFYVSLNLVAVTAVWILINFLTRPLMDVLVRILTPTILLSVVRGEIDCQTDRYNRSQITRAASIPMRWRSWSLPSWERKTKNKYGGISSTRERKKW